MISRASQSAIVIYTQSVQLYNTTTLLQAAHSVATAAAATRPTVNAQLVIGDHTGVGTPYRCRAVSNSPSVGLDHRIAEAKRGNVFVSSDGRMT